MSIHPKYCDLIAEGKKTIEVRKTRPKIDVPFKCYIYCTKPNTGSTEDRFYIYLPPHDTPKQVNGTVIGEFVCDKIISIPHKDLTEKNQELQEENKSLAKTVNEASDLIRKQRAKINRLKAYDEERDIALHARLVRETKQEVAREIKAMPKKFTEKSQDFEFGYRIAIQEILANLEKKHIGEKEE